MTLNEMVEYLREDILHDRSDQIDGESDRLWSKTTLIRHINEAQRRFARRSFCIRSTTTIYTVGYQKTYPLDPAVFSVISARFMGNGQWVSGVYLTGTYDDDGNFTPNVDQTVVDKIYPDAADLGRGGHSQFDQYVAPDRYYFDVNNLSTLPPSKPMAFDTDEFVSADINGTFNVVNARLYPIPNNTYAGCPVVIRCALKPKNLDLATPDAVSMVPEDYHIDMLDYAAYLCLRIVDHDSGDADRAKDFLASFTAKVEEARVDVFRKMFAPQAWGFGRNGFSYVGN